MTAVPVRESLGLSVIALVTTLGLLSAISQFFRNSIGVIATTLTAEMGLTADQLGLLSSSFFLVFALCQIPVGIVIDRWGPRAAMLGSAAFVVLGSLLFALAESAGALLTARLLLGVGCSSFLMAPLVIYARAYAPQSFSTFTGIQVGISSLGTLAATAPLAWSTATYGWRTAFLAAAVATTCVAIAVAIVTHAPRERAPRETEPLAETLRGVARATRVAGFWRLFAMQFVTYSTFALIVGLWGGPYLAHVHGMDVAAQGAVLLAMAIAQVIGVMLWGAGDRVVGAYRPLGLTAGTASVALLVTLAFAGHGSAALATTLIAALGFFTGHTPVLMAHGKSLFPTEMTGRGMTLLNIGTMGGGFVMQVVTGYAVRSIAGPADIYPVTAFQAAFLIQAAVILAALLLYWNAPDPRRAMGERTKGDRT